MIILEVSDASVSFGGVKAIDSISFTNETKRSF